MGTDCICDKIYGAKHSQCERSTHYLCENRANPTVPVFSLDGLAIDRETALQTISTWLKQSHYPLITGLEMLGARAQMQAVWLAKKYKAVVDSGWSGSAELASLVRVGNVTATLGEISRRTDRLLLLNCNPKVSHPRLWNHVLQRQTDLEIGYLASSATEKLNLSTRPVFELATDAIESDLMLLQSAIAGTAIRQQSHANRFKELAELASWLLNGNYTTILTGQLTDSCLDTVTLICQILTRKTRAVSIALTSNANKLGAHSTLAACTGFARAVDLSRGYPICFGEEYSSRQVLSRGEADLVLTFAPNVVEHTAQLRTISFGCLSTTARESFEVAPSFENGQVSIENQAKIRARSASEGTLPVDVNSSLAGASGLYREKTATSKRESGADSSHLQISNLSVLDDDFCRIDHLEFGVSKGEDSVEKLVDFLHEI